MDTRLDPVNGTRIYPRPTGPGWEPEITDGELLNIGMDNPTGQIETLVREKRALKATYLNLRDVAAIADEKVRDMARGAHLVPADVYKRNLLRWKSVESLARVQMEKMRRAVVVAPEELDTLIVRWLILTQLTKQEPRELEGRQVKGGILEVTAGRAKR